MTLKNSNRAVCTIKSLFPTLDLSHPLQRNHCHNFLVYPEKFYAYSNINGLSTQIIECQTY